jgi:hypothetical protein
VIFRNRIRITVVLSAAVIIAGVFFLLQADRKKAVETLLHKGCEAIQTKNTDKLAPLISLSYRDDLGLNYAALPKAFQSVFSQFSDISVNYRVTGITLGKDTVTADITVWARGSWMGGTQDIAGKEDDPVPLIVLCRKEMFSWKVVGSRWPRGKAGLKTFN